MGEKNAIKFHGAIDSGNDLGSLFHSNKVLGTTEGNGKFEVRIMT